MNTPELPHEHTQQQATYMKRQQVGVESMALQHVKVLLFGRQHKQQRASARSLARSTTNSVHVVAGFDGRVVLQNPVDLRQVQTTGSDVRAEENACSGLRELLEGCITCVLFSRTNRTIVSDQPTTLA